MTEERGKPPLSVAEFRKLSLGLEADFVIPEVPQKRKVTNKEFTIVLAVCLGLLAIFLIYCGTQAHLNRLTHGYDNCGNVCGEKNPVIPGIACSGEDDTNKPYLKYISGTKDDFTGLRVRTDEEMKIDGCVEDCGPDYFKVFNRCFPGKSFDGNKYFSEIAEDLNKGTGYLIALIVIGLGACFGMLALFRYCPALIVWIILIGSVVGFTALTVYMWYVAVQDESPSTFQLRVFATFLTIITLVIIALLVFLQKKIRLVIRLFKEAMRAVFGIPLILFEPLLTFAASIVMLICFFYFIFMLESAGDLQQVEYNVYQYVQTGFVVFTMWFNVVIFIWMAQFIIGCQHMVVSGAISAYYFARDKSSVPSPIYNSFYNLIRYHLGTVAFGSLLIAIITIIKASIRGLASNRHTQLLIECCLRPVEDFLKYLSKNAYIQTAMHGQSFYKSGKRAARLLFANALSAIAINSIGDFVMFMAKLLICLFTVLIGIAMLINSEIKHFYVIVVIGLIITSILADCFFSVFETAIDTLFLCFCEDMSMNDGVTQPFYMSTDLMQYIEDARVAYKK